MNLEPTGPEASLVSEALPLRPDPATNERRPSVWRAGLELLHDVSVAVLFCVFVVTFVVQLFRVEGASMQPLLVDDERIVVNKLVYRFAPIARGDVVVFHYPREPAVSYIKRVIGLPGDVVELRQGLVYVNGRVLEESYLAAQFRDHDSQAPREVEQGYYFVLGDHRTSSYDSRTWGLVPERYIYGRAMLRLWPLSRIGVIH
jgi:signal peptidase I